jgi:hypothetical protein
MTLSPARGLAWAALSLVFFLAALVAILPLVAAVRLVWDAPHLVQMAAWSPIWGVLAVLGVLVAAQLALGAWLRPPPVAIGIAAVGIGLSTVVNVVLQQWEMARFGIGAAPELVGPTAGLFAVLIGLAVAGFSAFVAPRRLIGWPLAAVALGFAGVAIVVVSNAPGLADGIGAHSWPLAIWVGLSGVYALVVAGLVVGRALDRSPDALET